MENWKIFWAPPTPFGVFGVGDCRWKKAFDNLQECVSDKAWNETMLTVVLGVGIRGSIALVARNG
jgi:hypothetical protein